ncbi:hypothetical protein ACSBR2_021034 [Camellia fascicularis]
MFTVNSVVKWCESLNGPPLTVTDLIWHNPSPSKAQFFSWLAWKGRINSSDYLHRIGILNAVVNSDCVFCQAEVESLNHVLLLCPFAWKVWSNLMKWWGLLWVSPSSVVMLMHWWLGWKSRKKEKQVWRSILIAALWSLWKCRNDYLFNGQQHTCEDLCELIKVRVALWLKSHSIGQGYTVNEFVSNIREVRSCL